MVTVGSSTPVVVAVGSTPINILRRALCRRWQQHLCCCRRWQQSPNKILRRALNSPSGAASQLWRALVRHHSTATSSNTGAGGGGGGVCQSLSHIQLTSLVQARTPHQQDHVGLTIVEGRKLSCHLALNQNSYRQTVHCNSDCCSCYAVVIVVAVVVIFFVLRNRHHHAPTLRLKRTQHMHCQRLVCLPPPLPGTHWRCWLRHDAPHLLRRLWCPIPGSLDEHV